MLATFATKKLVAPFANHAHVLVFMITGSVIALIGQFLKYRFLLHRMFFLMFLKTWWWH